MTSPLQDIEAVCLRALDSRVDALLFRQTAVGDVFGVRLADGRGVVVKVHPARESAETLAAVVAVQAHHFRAGFPCPEPLAGLLACGDRQATIEALVDDGEPADTRDQRRRRLVAEALADHLELARQCGRPLALRRGWSAYPAGRLWPADAHDARLVLPAAVADTRWIDEIAARVKPIATRPAPPVLGHHDWSGKHFRFHDDRVAVVYDWDSVRVGTEPVIVGNAASSCTTTSDLPGVDPAPSPEDVEAFLDDYDRALPAWLTRAEREQVLSCGTYLMAYVARCEPAQGDAAGPFTRALRRHGVRYLET